MQMLQNYFPELTPQQIQQFDALPAIYAEWNDKINVVSRNDIDNLMERHVLHALGIAKVLEFLPGSHVLDVGTGGGFPGVPLAILYPKTHFHLVDSVAKKIMVVKEVCKHIGLSNVKAEQARAESLKGSYDFVISRAVTQLVKFYPWVAHQFKPESLHELKNGVLYLKGGDLQEEIEASKLKSIKTYTLSDYFEEPFFDTKKVLYVPAQKSPSFLSFAVKTKRQ